MPKNLYDLASPHINSKAAKSWAETGIKNAIIFSCKDELTCEACKRADEQKISTESAQNPDNVPPWKFCTSKQGCRCILKPIVDVNDF